MAAHHHGHHMHHVAARQLRRPEEDEDENPGGPRTVIEVVFETMRRPQETEAPENTGRPTRTLIPPVVNTDPAPSPSDAETSRARPTPSDEDARPTRSVRSSIDFDETLRPTRTPTTLASTMMIAGSSPVITGLLGGATESPAASPSTSSEPEAASEGMSTGAKAGLALGVLFGVCAILTGVLLLYRRKKLQMHKQQSAEDEKSSMQTMHNFPPPPARAPAPAPIVVTEAAPSVRSQRTADTAPRLSLRPVTQFSPTWGENRKSGGNMLDVASAAAVPNQRSLSPDRPSSSWERPGASNAPAANPFNDPQPQLSSSPPQDPFANAAVIETPRSTSPGTPMTANMPDAAEFGAVAAAAAAAPVVAAAAVAGSQNKNEQKENERSLPPPPGINADSVPPSPAWTEDIPASPGPAPTGPPPVAGPNNVHRVQLDFKPSMDDELGLRAGQLVRMLHEYDDGWALCVRMDRSQQGVVPRTCLSKHPVKPRVGPPRQPPGQPRMRGPPPNGAFPPHGGVPQPRPLSPASGRSSPHPPTLSPAGGRMSPAPRSMSPGPNQMPPPQGRNRSNSNAPYAGPPRSMSPNPNQMPPQQRMRSNSNAPYNGPPRSMSPGPHQMPPQQRMRSNSNAPYAGPPRSMSPGPYGGGPQQHGMQPPQMGRPRSNSAGGPIARRGSPPGSSPMNPNSNAPMPSRKPLPGQAL